MNLQKAIEKLVALKEGIDSDEMEDYANSVQLGIEALNRLRELRSYRAEDQFALLPGETED